MSGRTVKRHLCLAIFTLLLRDRSDALTLRYSEQKQLREEGELRKGLGVS